MKSFRVFFSLIARFSIAAMILLGLIYTSNQFVLKLNFTNIHFYLILITWAFTLSISIYLFINYKQSDSNQFNRKYFVSSGIKIAGYLIFLIIFLLSFRNQVIEIIITTAMSYILFTFIEIIWVLKFLKKNQDIISKSID